MELCLQFPWFLYLLHKNEPKYIFYIGLIIHLRSYLNDNIEILPSVLDVKRGPANLIHMLWRCPKLHRYWQSAVETINGMFGKTKLPMEPGICLLNMIEECRTPDYTYTA